MTVDQIQSLTKILEYVPIIDQVWKHEQLRQKLKSQLPLLEKVVRSKRQSIPTYSEKMMTVVRMNKSLTMTAIRVNVSPTTAFWLRSV